MLDAEDDERGPDVARGVSAELVSQDQSQRHEHAGEEA